MLRKSGFITLKDVLQKKEVTLLFELSEQEKKIIIDECSLVDMPLSQANIKAYPIANNKGIGIELEIAAEIIHECVVTLKPVPQNIHEKIVLRFLPDGQDQAGNIESDSIYLNDDVHTFEPEDLIDDEVNLFELVREHIVLGLDPLPRYDDADFGVKTFGNLTEEERKIVNTNLERIEEGKPPLQTQNPFAALADLKNRL